RMAADSRKCAARAAASAIAGTRGKASPVSDIGSLTKTATDETEGPGAAAAPPADSRSTFRWVARSRLVTESQAPLPCQAEASAHQQGEGNGASPRHPWRRNEYAGQGADRDLRPDDIA